MSKKARKNIRLLLSGASGRMGLEILALSKTHKSLEVVAEISGSKDWKKVDPSQVDLVVDFSTPEGLEQAIDWSLKNKKPLVSGTTGISVALKKQIKEASKTIRVLYSGNMSMGIAVMSAMLRNLSAVSTWDFQIEEAHHSKKVDRPSGTAILLQETLSEAVGRKLPSPNSIRGGGVPGLHQVWAMGPEESIILQHTAYNRTVFARGALTAAMWLFDKKGAGIYDLSDLYQMN